MKKQNKDLLIKVFSVFGDEELGYRARIQKMKELLMKNDVLDNKEKSFLFKYFQNLAKVSTPDYLKRNYIIQDATKAVNRAERASTARRKNKLIKETLRENRSQRLPIIFYLCSYHEKCAEDHKAYQGKLYVDRYWRSSLEQYQDLWWLIQPVEAYIKNHSVMTMQEVIGDKPYLTTRPYCKHFFTPVDVWTVLTSSVQAIKREHPESVSGTGKKSFRQYRQDYYKLRENIRKGLE